MLSLETCKCHDSVKPRSRTTFTCLTGTDSDGVEVAKLPVKGRVIGVELRSRQNKGGNSASSQSMQEYLTTWLPPNLAEERIIGYCSH